MFGIFWNVFFFFEYIFIFVSQRGGGGRAVKKMPWCWMHWACGPWTLVMSSARACSRLNLEVLTFGYHFRQNLEGLRFPSRLRSLTLGPDCPLVSSGQATGVSLPTGLQHLTYGGLLKGSLESVFSCQNMWNIEILWEWFQHVSTCFNMFQPVLGTWLPAPCSVCIPNTPWIEIPLLVDFWGQELIALTCLIFCVDILYILCDIL